MLAQLPSAEPSNLKGHLHFLKGSALNIGLDGVSDLCREGEEALKSNPDALVRINDIRDTYQAARRELSDLF